MTELLTTKTIAKRYGVTPKTVRRWTGKVSNDIGQALDKQGTLGFTEDEVLLIVEAGGRKPIQLSCEAVDAELVEDEGTLTLSSGTGMRLNRPNVGRLSININFDLGGASLDESGALTSAADNELMNMGTVLGAALGEGAVRSAFQKQGILTANITTGMVQGAHTALSSQGVVQKEVT